MNKKNGLAEKIFTAFGILALISGVYLVISGDYLIGTSGAIVGLGLTWQNIKAIRDGKEH